MIYDHDDFDHDSDDGFTEENRVNDRTMLIHVNAMGWKDAAEGISERSGNLDFSNQERLDGAFDPDKLPTLNEASGTDQEQIPGGYEILVLRRGYLNASGNEVDSEVAILSISEPLPFFENCHLRGMDPALPGYIRADKKQDRLTVTLAPENHPAPSVRRHRL